MGLRGGVTRLTVDALRDISSLSDFERPMKKKRPAPKAMTPRAARTIPAMAPPERACPWEAGTEVDVKVDVAEGRVDESVPSAGKASPGLRE